MYGEIWLDYDGQHVKIDGLCCKISAQVAGGRVYAAAEPVNKQAKSYCEIRRMLGDDWATDLMNLNDENFVSVLHQLPGAVEKFLGRAN